LLFFWPVWTLLGWGLAVGSHAIRVFGPQESRDSRDRGDRWDRHQEPWNRRPEPWGRYSRGSDGSRRRRSRPQIYR
jgi:hypothetical protein